MPYGKKIYEFDILKIHDNVGKRDYILDADIKKKVQEIFERFNGKITETQKFLKQNPFIDKNGRPIIEAAFKINVEKYRKRISISKLSDRGTTGIKTIKSAISFINKISDFNIRKDLIKHLEINENDIDKAFSSEGIERFNNEREIPIYKLPIAEKGTERFAIGNRIGSKHKWGEAEKGTNLFFAIYTDKEGNKSYETIPLNIVVERLKQGLKEVPEKKIVLEKGEEKELNLLFSLSPNDLVYVPTEEESESGISSMNIKPERIYKMVSSSGYQCFFVPNYISTPIVQTTELGSNNKSEKSWDSVQIKQKCIKLTIDRLGNLI